MCLRETMKYVVLSLEDWERDGDSINIGKLLSQELNIAGYNLTHLSLQHFRHISIFTPF